jgi:hypothetical protein
MPFTYSHVSSRTVRLPLPNRHITGQGHYRTPQKH